MPQYFGLEESNRSQPKIVHWKPLLILTVFYYFISCGVERIYQPMVSKPETPQFIVLVLSYYIE